MKRRQDGRVAQPSPPSNPGGRGRSRRSRSPGSRIILRRTFPDLPRRSRVGLDPVVISAFVPGYSGGGRAGFEPASLLSGAGAWQRVRPGRSRRLRRVSGPRARRACGLEPAGRLGRSHPRRQALCGGRIDPVPRHREVPVQAIESSIPCKTRCALRGDGRRLAPNSLDSLAEPFWCGGASRRRVKTLAARAT